MASEAPASTVCGRTRGAEERQHRHPLLHQAGDDRRARAVRRSLRRGQPVHQPHLPVALPEPAGAADLALRRGDAHDEPRPDRHRELDLQLAVQPRPPGRIARSDQQRPGRWNVVTSFDSQVSKNFGLDEHLDYATRYGRALEFVEVARGLWDSYEDDAFPADVERNVFLDPSKLHALNHVGEHFKVAGPLNLSRSKQGQPVIFQSGVSEDGRTWPRTSPRASTRPAIRWTRHGPTTPTSSNARPRSAVTLTTS